MADRWIVRVQEREYGPVDFATLQEWKKEGRVIPENPARPANADAWTTAAKIPGLFGVAPPLPHAEDLEADTIPAMPRDSDAGVAAACAPPRSFGKIIGATVRIYGRKFFSFIGLALLMILPSVCGQLATVWTQTTSPGNIDIRTILGDVFAFFMLVASIVLWPIYIAGIQIIAAETFADRPIGFVAALNRAVAFWPRLAALCLFVYGVFFLLSMFAVAIAIMILAGGSSPLVILFALFLLAVQVWLFGRFFINVLFWQQFAVLENVGVADSLRASKNLARSGHDLPWYRRPWWRGGLIVSIWVAFVLAITVVPQWSTMRQYWTDALTIQDPQLLYQKIAAAEQARALNFLILGLAIVQKSLQPLLGIAFVVLFFDSKTRSHDL